LSALSPGSAQAALELLRMIGTQGLTGAAVVEGLRRIGGIASAQVLELTQTLNWIALDENGLLVVSPSGIRVLAAPDYAGMIAQTLLDYAELVSPPWLQNALSGRARVLHFAEVGVQQLIVEAGLAEGTDERMVLFWDRLQALARGRRDDHLLTIGRDGERLSIRHETARTGRAPRWVAIDSNEDGFDLLSVTVAGERAPLAIEVKASTLGLRGAAHITRNEWDTAVSGIAHVFHFWASPLGAPPSLAVIEAADLRDHVPDDRGDGAWESVLIPFAPFEARFGEPLDA
jgi:hypothetical protein